MPKRKKFSPSSKNPKKLKHEINQDWMEIDSDSLEAPLADASENLLVSYGDLPFFQ